MRLSFVSGGLLAALLLAAPSAFGEGTSATVTVERGAKAPTLTKLTFEPGDLAVVRVGASGAAVWGFAKLASYAPPGSAATYLPRALRRGATPRGALRAPHAGCLLAIFDNGKFNAGDLFITRKAKGELRLQLQGGNKNLPRAIEVQVLKIPGADLRRLKSTSIRVKAQATEAVQTGLTLVAGDRLLLSVKDRVFALGKGRKAGAWGEVGRTISSASPRATTKGALQLGVGDRQQTKLQPTGDALWVEDQVGHVTLTINDATPADNSGSLDVFLVELPGSYVILPEYIRSVPACRTYWRSYMCYVARLPAAAQAPARKGMRILSKAWGKVPRAGLAAGCKAAVDALRKMAKRPAVKTSWKGCL